MMMNEAMLTPLDVLSLVVNVGVAAGEDVPAAGLRAEQLFTASAERQFAAGNFSYASRFALLADMASHLQHTRWTNMTVLFYGTSWPTEPL